MGNNSRIMVGLFFSMIMQVSFSMDADKSLGASSGQSSGEWSNSFSFNIPFPSFNDMSCYFTNNLDSLKNTVTNTVSDDAALKKLGWPVTDSAAQAELRKSTARYAQFLRLQDGSEREQCFAFVERREGYVKRACLMLPLRPDGMELAAHCLEHHHMVMHSFLKKKFVEFVAEKDQKSKHVVSAVNKFLIEDTKESNKDT